jgi:hypothetical protein
MQLLGLGKGNHTPILTYHSISNNLFGQSHPYHQINTAPGVFSNQMRWLRSQGYQGIHLTDMLDQLAAGKDMSKRVVITFDGGYRDFLTEGFEVMKQCGFTATVFLVTDRIRKTPTRFEGVDYLTWHDVHELHAEGIRFGSRTVTHPDLRSMEPQQIEYELGYSKEIIEQKLGEPIDCFSYPFTFPEEDREFSRYIGDMLENEGFRCGVSSIIGRAHQRSNHFFLPRIPINSWDTTELLRAKLRGAYDWMHLPQLAKRFIFHNISLMELYARMNSSDAG